MLGRHYGLGPARQCGCTLGSERVNAALNPGEPAVDIAQENAWRRLGRLTESPECGAGQQACRPLRLCGIEQMGLAANVQLMAFGKFSLANECHRPRRPHACPKARTAVGK
jgi:hypothetical protein